MTSAGHAEGPSTALLELPSDGVINRAVFEALPTPARAWAWELRNGRLELVHMPVSAYEGWLAIAR